MMNFKLVNGGCTYIQQEHKILKIAVAPHVVSLQRAMCTYPPFNELG